MQCVRCNVCAELVAADEIMLHSAMCALRAMGVEPMNAAQYYEVAAAYDEWDEPESSFSDYEYYTELAERMGGPVEISVADLDAAAPRVKLEARSPKPGDGCCPNPVLSKPVILEKDGSSKIMTPADARQRNLVYAMPLHVDVRVNASTMQDDGSTRTETKTLRDVNIGKLPIMVGSKYCVLTSMRRVEQNECKHELGGYFIINGNEKVVISQDRIAENRTHCFSSNKLTYYSHIAEIRSVKDNVFGVPKATMLKLSAKSNQFGRFVCCNIHHVKHDVPLFVLFRALGVESDRDICRRILHDLDSPASRNLMEHLVFRGAATNRLPMPRTGMQMETLVFVGPTSYQRLKHMTADKLHSRNCNGPIVLMTRQPAEGRARDGGLRLGEMEIECLESHWSMGFMKERLQDCSDNYRVFICRKCGRFATAANPERNIWKCLKCKNLVSIAEVRMPYSCKLLMQEIQTMAIATKFAV
ncbi:hypothetical protein OEZ85_014478 [Tetradesmus obliquus]|uniref:DNA-directed RNA polymerase n=1 Tax=Tetradesmus obliquus TaxID=3088 RepID=A0ABY8U907_TETOB|nr:hypothetical protein OEZ85_014478 [Tetradesmus obliquus]